MYGKNPTGEKSVFCGWRWGGRYPCDEGRCEVEVTRGGIWEDVAGAWDSEEGDGPDGGGCWEGW